MDLINSLTMQAMGKALDGLAKRHTAIASNLANVDTPHYRKREVSFEGSLQQALNRSQGQKDSGQASNDQFIPLKTTRPDHFLIGHVSNTLAEVQPEVETTNQYQYRNDGNTVDVEGEMVSLAKNTQKYLAISNLESRNFKSLRSVITGGGS